MRMGPTTSRRALVGAAAVALVVGVVAGCSGGNAKPGPSATAAPSAPTASASPTASPTPDASVKPVRPAAMDQVNPAGAEAVAVYFLNLYPYVYASNDLTEWKALSHAECVFCASVTDHVKKQVAEGHRSTGGLVSIESVSGVEVSPGFFSVRVAATQAPSSEYAPDGSVADTSPGSDSQLTLVVLRSGSSWQVRAVQVDETPKS